MRQDDTAANEWWLRAASQDFAPAQFNLATQYYFGRGVELNETEAIRWYRRAADNGHPRAKEMFAGETSDVVTVDAVEWIRSQSPGHFTIQLLASTQQASADVLARHPSFPSNQRTEYFAFLREGQQWYAIIHGVFTTRAQAQEAAQELPGEFRTPAPWIRRFEDVANIAVRLDQQTVRTKFIWAGADVRPFWDLCFVTGLASL